MKYPLKTLGQLSLMIRGFRQSREYTQAAMAEKLGITQQSYAHFEANAATATVERLFVVLRILDVEISLNQADSIANMSPAKATIQRIEETGVTRQKAGKPARAVTIRKVKPSSEIKQGRIIPTTKKKENW